MIYKVKLVENVHDKHTVAEMVLEWWMSFQNDIRNQAFIIIVKHFILWCLLVGMCEWGGGSELHINKALWGTHVFFLASNKIAKILKFKSLEQKKLMQCIVRNWCLLLHCYNEEKYKE